MLIREMSLFFHFFLILLLTLLQMSLILLTFAHLHPALTPPPRAFTMLLFVLMGYAYLLSPS